MTTATTSHRPCTAADPFTATAPGARQAAYARLAAAGPVHRITLPSGVPAWLVTGHDEVRAVLADPRLVKAEPGRLGPRTARDLALNSDLLHADPPDHTRLRRLVSAAFTRRRTEALGPRIGVLTEDLLDGLHGEVDLIAAFACPLPITVICELLGVPASGRTWFREWSTVIVSGSLAAPDAWDRASDNMLGHVRELIAAKRARPADDLLSALITARDGADRLSEDELTSMVFLLLVAGHETTVNLIGNAVHALLTHPGPLAMVRAEPERLPAVVEETLRYEPPVQVATFRWTAEPVRIGDTVLPAGELVVPGLLTAGRDPGVVDAPDTFDPTRDRQPHLGFGHGIHHCVGAPLARLEARIALGGLLRRFPGLALAAPADELVWRPGVLMHGLDELPVQLHPGPADQPARSGPAASTAIRNTTRCSSRIARR